MPKLELSCFGHIVRRQDCSEETVMLGKTEGCSERERPTVRRDSINGATDMSRDPSRAVEDRTLCTSLCTGLPGVDSRALNPPKHFTDQHNL